MLVFIGKWPCRLTEQSAEGDGWREGGEVDKDERGQALEIQTVLDVAKILREANPDIVNHPAETPLRSPQGVPRRCLRDKG